MSLFHYHTRKRREPYPAHSLSLRLLDGTVYAVGILGPIATIPQMLQIYLYHNAAGVSLASWSLYTLFDIPWIIYAIVHKERPLVVCYVLWFIFNGMVAVGALLYGV